MERVCNSRRAGQGQVWVSAVLHWEADLEDGAGQMARRPI